MKILFLILALALTVSSALAQPAAPPWVQQLKLSGLSGTTGHRLAVINNKTFSAGDAASLQLKGRTVQVQCLEISDQSVLVKIQNLPTPYELTMGGEVIPVGVASSPPETAAPATVAEPPKPAAAPPIIPVAFSQPTFNPSPVALSLSVGPGWILLAVIIALVAGLALGTGAAQFQHRKNMGEAMLAYTIDKYFSRQHFLLNNITLPTSGGTTQIDHVLIADTGIFVIETKHYSGWIFGNPQDSQWTQTFYRKKSGFQNPLRQNYAHVKALQSLFDLPDNQFHSLVVFTADAEFKTDLGPSVVKLTGLIPFLTANRPVVFDERKMAYIIGRIEMKRERRSLETDEYRLNHLRDRLAGKAPSPGTQTLSPPPASQPVATGEEKYQPKA